MKMKVDLSGLKSFFLDKGEKIGMAVCVAVAGVLVGYGITHSNGAAAVPGSGRSYKQALLDKKNEIKSKLDGGTALDANAPAGPAIGNTPEWPSNTPDFPWTGISVGSDRTNNKRVNPRALAPLTDIEGKHVQMDYIRGAYFAYDINHQFKTATVFADPKDAKEAKPKGFPFAPVGPGPRNAATTLQPIITVQPVRMVVVHAVFPLTDQIQEYRKAFRMLNDHELFTSRDLPRFLGMNIMKTEVVNGKPPVWTPLALSSFDGTNEKLDVDPAILTLLKQSIFDDAQPSYAHAMIQGLAMPLPKLATLPPGNVYPKVELAGVNFGEENAVPEGLTPEGAMKLPGMPGKGFMPGAPGAKGELDSKIPWSKLSPELREKFSDGGIFPLDPSGIHPDPEEAKNALPGVNENRQPTMVSGPMFKSGSAYAASHFWTRYPMPPVPANLLVDGKGAPVAAPAPASTIKPYDAVIRFIDPDVQPGKTYRYSIQVRLANPNFGKKSEVAFAALADVKELKPAAPVETPTITIPDEYFLYAVDQKPDNPKIQGGSDDKDARPDQAAIQVHRWMKASGDSETGVENVIGDWVIAERLLVHRGDPVGRIVNVEVPVWDKTIAKYALGNTLVVAGKKKAIVQPPKGLGKFAPPKKEKDEMNVESVSTGIPIDFAETAPPAVLIDFDGGKKIVTMDGKSIRDDSASNLLILKADGRLIVRNNRTDSDPDSDESKDRQSRVEEWKTKVGEFRTNAPRVPGAPPNRDNLDGFKIR